MTDTADDNLVGIVLVSHSLMLATSTAELANQLGGGQVPVVAAGGTAGGQMGTSTDVIEGAVRAANRGAGVVLIPDIGSSVMTSQTMLAELDPESKPEQPNAVIADAPFLEGAVAAAAAAGGGADMDSVVKAASEAYTHHKL